MYALMVDQSISCVDCHSSHVLKNGMLPSWWQRYHCADCDGHFSLGGKRDTYSAEFKQKVVTEYLHSWLPARIVADQYDVSLSTIVLRARQHKKICDTCQHH